MECIVIDVLPIWILICCWGIVPTATCGTIPISIVAPKGLRWRGRLAAARCEHLGITAGAFGLKANTGLRG